MQDLRYGGEPFFFFFGFVFRYENGVLLTRDFLFYVPLLFYFS